MSLNHDSSPAVEGPGVSVFATAADVKKNAFEACTNVFIKTIAYWHMFDMMHLSTMLVSESNNQ